MLCSVSFKPPSLHFRKISFPKVIVEKASDKRASDLTPLEPCISFNHSVYLCCAAPLKDLSYPTYAPNKSPKKITLRLRNVCSQISRLNKNNFKDASLSQPSASLTPLWKNRFLLSHDRLMICDICSRASILQIADIQKLHLVTTFVLGFLFFATICVCGSKRHFFYKSA